MSKNVNVLIIEYTEKYLKCNTYFFIFENYQKTMKILAKFHHLMKFFSVAGQRPEGLTKNVDILFYSFRTFSYDIMIWKTFQVMHLHLRILLKNDEKVWICTPHEIFWAAGQRPEGLTKYLYILFYSIRTLSYNIVVWKSFQVIFVNLWKSPNWVKTSFCNPPPTRFWHHILISWRARTRQIFYKCTRNIMK